MQAWFNLHKSINVIYHINTIKYKSQFHFNRCKKAFVQIKNSFMIKKTLKTLGIEGKYLNIITVIYNKPTSNIKLIGKRLKALPFRLGRRQVCPFSPLLINIVLEVLARSIRQEKNKKRHSNHKGRSKMVCVCRWHNQHNLIYIKPWRFHQKNVRTNQSFE